MMSTRKKNTFKRRLLDFLFKWIAIPLITLLMRLWAKTVRLEWKNKAWFDSSIYSGRPVVAVFWHEDLISACFTYLHVRPICLCIMVSYSRDGEMLSEILRKMQVHSVRGSSSRRGASGFLECYHWLTDPESSKDSRVAVMALDGPRGPRRQAKSGAVAMARKAEAIIMPMCFTHSRQIRFHSWDQTLMTKPFSTLYIQLGKPIDMAEHDHQNSDDDITKHLETTLNELKQKAGCL